MQKVAERLHRKADEYAALREEHATEKDAAVYVAVEVVLRELAEALAGVSAEEGDGG